jgi:ELWxxDGT repeat protein
MVADNALFFFAYDPIHGRELWKTDGTESGTVLVKDINIGINNSDSKVLEGSVTYSGYLFFSANDGIHGAELWKSDGTETGTVMIKDINKGEKSSRPSNFMVYHDIIYFSAADSSWVDSTSYPLITVYNTELYRTDGSETGTFMVKEINQDKRIGSAVGNLMVCNNHLLFAAEEFGSTSRELWTSDGTNVGTHLLKDIYPGQEGSYPTEFAPIGNTVYFRARDYDHGQELWKTSGDENNTNMVYDILPGYSSSFPQKLTIADSNLYFITDNYEKLWKLNVIAYSISSISSRPKINVYPVPFTDKIFITGSEYQHMIMSINIYNRLGQKVFFEEHNSSETIIIKNLDFLEPGLYILTILIDNESISQKVLKIN